MANRPCCRTHWIADHPRPADDVYLGTLHMAELWDDALFDLRWSGIPETHQPRQRPAAHNHTEEYDDTRTTRVDIVNGQLRAPGGHRGGYDYWRARYVETGDPADLDRMTRSPLPGPEPVWITTKSHEPAGPSSRYVLAVLLALLAALVIVLVAAHA
jgi:hypothetical protein